MMKTVDPEASANNLLDLERGALDRWGQGDPTAVLELYAPDITYFDPLTPTRIDGYDAMEKYYRPFAGKIHIARYEIVHPQVAVDGNMALVTYNLVNYSRDGDGNESVTSRWNNTSVYQRCGNVWKQIHSHWSFTRHPAFENMTPESSEGVQS